MFTLIILGLIGWFAYRHFANKKREADRRSWSVDFREQDIRPVTRRLPWNDLP
jgi:predicted negative regulator of RcsB-dependent stress response